MFMLFIDLKMRFKTNVISKGMCDISLNQLSYPNSISSLRYIFQPYQQNCISSSFSFLRPTLSFLCCFYSSLYFICSMKRFLDKLIEILVPPLYAEGLNSVQSLSCVQLFATPWTTAGQALLSITNSWSLLNVHWAGDAIQPSHPLLSPSPPAFSLSQHQSLFQQVRSSHQVVKVLEFQLHNQSFQWIFRIDFL